MKMAVKLASNASNVKEGGRTVAVRDWLRSCPVVPSDMTCGELAEQFRREPAAECAVVCGENRRPVGIMMKARFFRSLGSTFGSALFTDKKISHLMDRNPFVSEIAARPGALIDGALSRGEETFYDAVVVTEDGKLAGILTVRDLLMMSRQLQEEAADRQVQTVRGTETMVRDILQAVANVTAASEEMRDTSVRMAEAVRHGRQDLEQMMRLFRRWSESAAEQEKAMRELTEGAKAVNEVAKLIAELADQCNLLAVNAAIEAARAGAHGRGFGVVAQDIRRLADGTKRSAGEIHKTLRTMADAVSRTDEWVREGKRGADLGVDQVRGTERAFAQLWEASEANGEAALRLGAAAKEAAGTAGDVRRAISQLLLQIQPSGC